MIVIGLFLGCLFGFLLAAMLTAGKIEDTERENHRLNYENTVLRERLKLLKKAAKDALEENGG